MAGFNNEVVYGANVDFSGSSTVTGQITTNGQLLIGSTVLNAGGTHINVGNLTSPDGTVTIGYSSPNITLHASPGITAPGTTVVGDVVLWNSITGAAVSDAGFGFPLTETHGGTAQTTYTTGDILYASTTNTLSKLAIGTSDGFGGFPLISDGSLPVWCNPYKYLYVFDDFNSGNVGNISLPNWFIASANSGSVSQVGSTTTNPGVMLFQTNGNASAQAIMRWGENNSTGWPFNLGGGSWDVEFFLNLSNLSDGTDTYTVRFGLTNANGSGAPGDGVFFSYTDVGGGGATPNWQINSFKTGVGDLTQDSGIAAAITTYKKFRISVNAGATAVHFYIDGVETSNSPMVSDIPTARIGPQIHLIKSAGTNNRTLGLDVFRLFHILTTAR